MIDLLLPHLMIWIVAVPLLAGTLAFILGRPAGAPLGLATSGLVLGLAGLLADQVIAEGALRYTVGGWGQPLGIDLVVDGFSALLLVLGGVVGLGVSVYASRYFDAEDAGAHAPSGLFFWPLWLFLWGGINALLVSADMFNLYVTLEVLTFSAVALIAFAGSTACLSAATRYLLLALVGSLSYLLGVGMLYGGYGTLDLAGLAEVIRPGLATSVAVILMTFGLAIKTALFPMHFWLPPAHAHAPAPVSAVLSGLVVTASFYLLARLWFGPFRPVITPEAGHVLGGLGSLAILWGSIQAIRQPRLKMLVAYSTVAQLGYAVLLFALAGEAAPGRAFAWSGGVYLAISHACAKAAAFLSAGAILCVLGHDRIADLGGLARRFPVPIFAFALAGVNLVGLPPSGGFVGKWMLLKAALLNGQWWYASVIIVGGLLAAAYVFRVLERVMTVPEPGAPPLPVPHRLAYPALGLALVAVVLGLLATAPLDLLSVGSPFEQIAPWRAGP